MAEVVLKGIRKSFAGPAGQAVEVLKGIDLEAHSAECLALLGPSGCGKTTLLRIIAGLERPDAGAVVMEGRDMTPLPPEKRPTAMVFQNYALFPHLSVEGNVAFGLKLRRRPRAEIRRKVDQALETVQLAGMNKRRIDQLSGGQQQRVALARVLAVEPKILLMDEPLSNLDAALRRATRSAIRKIQTDLRLTLIYVTHDQEEALMMSDRMALMQAGEILQVGTPREIYDLPASLEVARFIGQRNLIPAFVRGFGEDCVKLALSRDESSPLVWVTANATGIRAKAGDAVWLALKPADLALGDESRPGIGWLAEVVLSSFAGQSSEIELKLKDAGAAIRASLTPEETIPPRGSIVRVKVRRGGGLIYPREA